MLACPGGGQGEQEEEGKEHLLKVRASNLQPRNPSSPPSLPPHPPLSCNNKFQTCHPVLIEWKLVEAVKNQNDCFRETLLLVHLHRQQQQWESPAEWRQCQLLMTFQPFHALTFLIAPHQHHHGDEHHNVSQRG